MPTLAEVINKINSDIIANGNEEITGLVLNSVLLDMVSQINDLVGELGDLNTDDITSIVNAINSLKDELDNYIDPQMGVLTGFANPNETEPIGFNGRVGTIYLKMITIGFESTPESYWIYTGINDIGWLNLTADDTFKMVVVDHYEDLPAQGQTNRIYFVQDENNTYIWNVNIFPNDYILVGSVIEGEYISRTIFNDEFGNPVSPNTGNLYLDTAAGKYYRWDGNYFLLIDKDAGSGTVYVELTKTQLDTAIANKVLTAGTLYKITEVETWMKQGDTTKAIYLHAISTTELEKKGTGEFYVPKYNQGYDIWSGELWQKTSGAMGTEPEYDIDDVVIWGGKHWKNLTGNYGTFIDHYELDGTNWEEILVNDTDYNVRTNIIEYDYANDMITYRKDEVGNEVSTSYKNWEYWENEWFDGNPLSDSNYNPIKVFQWGNEYEYYSFVGVGFNIVENSLFECVNQRGLIKSNTLNNAFIYSNTLNNGYIESVTLNNGAISNNTLENNGYIYDNTLNNGYIEGNTLNDGAISNNTLENNGAISNNTLENDGRIYNNALNDGRIYNNALNNGYINGNTLNNGYIESVTLNNGYINNNTINNGYIRLGLSYPINNKQLQYLTVNTGDIGGVSGIDLSSATLVYQDYERIVFKDSTGTTKIRYYDGSGNLVVADLTD